MPGCVLTGVGLVLPASLPASPLLPGHSQSLLPSSLPPPLPLVITDEKHSAGGVGYRQIDRPAL